MPGSCRRSSCVLKRFLVGGFSFHVYTCLSYRKKSVSRHQSQPLSSDVICLKEMVSMFSSSRPFDHLEVVATLGVGGFGRVELVRSRRRVHCHDLRVRSCCDIPVGCFGLQVKMQDKDITFALKVIKKKHVVDNRQEEHIHSERKILAEARSPFVVKSVPSSCSQTGFKFCSNRSVMARAFLTLPFLPLACSLDQA